jgi:hypothetical protein
MRLDQQRQTHPVSKAIDQRVGRLLTAVVDHDDLETVGRIVEPRDRLETVCQPTDPAVRGHDDREEGDRLAHRRFRGRRWSST